MPSVVTSYNLRAYKISCSGNSTACTANHTGVIKMLRFTHKPKCVSGGNPVCTEVFGVSVACDNLMSCAESFIHLCNISLFEKVVRVKNEVTVVVFVANHFCKVSIEVIKSIALTHFLFIEPLVDVGSCLLGNQGGFVRTVVGYYIDVNKLLRIGLLFYTVDEITDNAFLVAGSQKEGVSLSFIGLFEFNGCAKNSNKYIENLVDITHNEG